MKLHLPKSLKTWAMSGFIALGAISSNLAYGADLTWNSGNSGDWMDEGFWNGETFQDGDNVIFGGPTGEVSVQVNQNITVGSISMRPDSSVNLIVNEGSVLNAGAIEVRTSQTGMYGKFSGLGTINATSFVTTTNDLTRAIIDTNFNVSGAIQVNRGSLHVTENAKISTNRFAMTDGGSHATTFNMTGGSLNITGSINATNGTGSFTLGHWGAKSTFNQSAGTVTSLLANLVMAKDGTSEINLSGSAVMNVLGLTANRNNASVLNLSGGRLNLGATGITTQQTFNFGAGTVGALTSWSASANISLVSTVGTTFDTEQWDAKAGAGNGIASSISLSGVLSGEGKLIKDGIGTLVLSGANTYSGGTELKEGTLQLNNATAIGSGGLLISGSSTLSTNLANGAISINGLTIGTEGSNVKFNMGGMGSALQLTTTSLSFEGDSTLVMDIGTTSDKLIYTGSGALTGSVNFEFNFNGLTEPTQFVVLESGGSLAGLTFGTWVPDYRGMEGALVVQGNNLVLDITNVGSAGNLTWTGANGGVWETLGTNVNWSGNDDPKFYNGDNVTFDNSATNKTVTIAGLVKPGSITVTADGYVFNSSADSAGGIAGTGSLTLNAANGKLIVNTANTYSGGTILTAGTFVAGNKKALGTGSVTFGGGSLEFASGLGTFSIYNQFLTTDSNNDINLVMNGNNVTLDSSLPISSGNVNLNVSGGGSFSFSGFMNINQVDVAANTTVVNYGVTNSGTHAHILRLSGEGDFVASTTGSSGRIYSQSAEGPGFTGTFYTSASAERVTLTTQNSTENNRFSLNLSQASGHFYIVNEESAVTTLFINNLNGNGNVEYTYSTNGGAYKRNLDMLLTEDCVYGGSFVYSSNRMGNVIVGSEGDTLHKISMSNGMNGTGGTGEHDGNLIINNAIVEFTGAGKWLGDIQFGTSDTGDSLGGQLILSGGGMDRTTADRFISGKGTIIVAAGENDENIFGVANNDFIGSIIINSGKLSATVVGALGANDNSVTVNGGTLNLGGVAHTQNITMTGGNLQNAEALLGNVSIDQSGKIAASMNMGGLNAGKITSFVGTVTNDTATQLTNLTGTLTLSGNQNVFGVSSGMVGQTNSGNSSIISGADVVITEGSTINLDFSSQAASELIENLGNVGSNQFITITDGMLTSNGSFDFSSKYAVLGSLFQVTGTQGGSLVLTQQSDENILIVKKGTSLTISALDQFGLDSMKHIINNGTINIDIAGNPDQNLVLNGFCGTDADALLNTGNNSNLVVEFAQGSAIADGATDTYEGSISGDAQLVKSGNYTMTVNGSLSASSLSITGGTFALGGKDGVTNTISGALSLASGTSLSLIGSNITTQVGSLVAGNDTTISLSNNAILSVGSDLVLDASVTGQGTIMVSDGSFSIGAGSVGAQVAVGVGTNGTWTLDKDSTVGGLAGNGVVNLNGNTITLQSANADFSGQLQGSGTIIKNGDSNQILSGSGNQNINLQIDQGTLTLNNQGNIQAVYGNTNVGAGGTLNIGNVANDRLVRIAGATNVTNVKLSSLTMADGASLNVTFAGNTQADTSYAPITTDTAAQLGNVNVTITCVKPEDFSNYDANGFRFTLIDGGSGEATLGDDYTLSMGFLNALFSWKLVTNGSDIDVVAKSREGNYYAEAGLTHNSMSVANLLFGNMQLIIDSPDTLLRALADSVANDIDRGKLGSAAQKMAAAGGSTITSLSMAQRDAFRDQMFNLRNRTVSMGVNQSVSNDDMPYYHMWVQGSGGFSDLKTDGDQSGYQMSSWGATVGVDVDINEHWTVGAAFTVNYGDLDASAADTASGKLDSYYVNLFARMQKSAWAHTFIVSGGWSDASLNRTVDFGDGSYRADGSTNGSGFGAMYELTYDYYMNEGRTSILQPLFNISYTRTTIKGYTETGAGNAGLAVDDQTMSTTTLALGGRWIGLFGNSLFGRESLGEVRVNVAQDFGDNQGKVNAGFLGNPSLTQSIHGAKVGSTAVQLGAGVTVPLNQNSSIFAEANADFRSKQNSVNGSIGYRYDF